jgi:hypothetical protein
MTVLRQSSALFCRNLQICDLWINHKNLLICDFWTNSPRKFADMRLRNERKNLRICNLRTLKISLLAHSSGRNISRRLQLVVLQDLRHL